MIKGEPDDNLHLHWFSSLDAIRSIYIIGRNFVGQNFVGRNYSSKFLPNKSKNVFSQSTSKPKRETSHSDKF